MASPASFPELDSTWESVDDFKLAAYGAALQHRSALSIRQSNGVKYIILGCPRLGGKCTHRLELKRTPQELEANLPLRVIQRDLKHSHPFDEEDHEAAAFTMRGKVQNLREDIVERGRLEEARARREEERERRALEDGEDGESSSGSEDEGNVVVRPTRRAARASGLASRELDEPSDDYPNDSPDEDGAESDDEDAPRSNDRVKLVHINAHSLVSQINALQNSGPLVLPSPRNDFSAPTHNAFRVHASAAALQRGFGIHLFGTVHSGDQAERQFELCCRFHAAHKCAWRMTVRRVDVDGVERWKAVSLVEGHKHPLGGKLRSAAPWSSEVPASGKKRRADDGGEEPASLQVKFPRRSTIPSPSSQASPIASTSRLPPPLKTSTPLCLVQTSSAASLSHAHTNAHAHAQRSTTSSFLPSLTSFLAFLSPSLAPHAPRLFTAGVRSLDSLLALIHLEEAQLAAFLRNEELGLPRIFQAILQKKLREARGEIVGE